MSFNQWEQTEYNNNRFAQKSLMEYKRRNVSHRGWISALCAKHFAVYTPLMTSVQNSCRYTPLAPSVNIQWDLNSALPLSFKTDECAAFPVSFKLSTRIICHRHYMHATGLSMEVLYHATGLSMDVYAFISVEQTI